MSVVGKRLMEVKASHLSLHFYQYLFDCLISFMAAMIIVGILGKSLAYVVFPFIFFAVLALVFEFRQWNIIGLIQKSYEELDERLETAIEADEDNPIAASLIDEVNQDIDGIGDSTFIDPRAIGVRISVLFILSLLLLTTSYFSSYMDLNNIFDESRLGVVRNFASDVENEFQVLVGNRWENSSYGTEKEEEKIGTESGGEQPGYSEGPIPGTGGGVGSDGSEDIYGDPSSASLYGRDIDFEMKPEYGGSIEIREHSGDGQLPEYAVGDVDSVEACRDCQIGPEHEELVRRYFQRLMES